LLIGLLGKANVGKSTFFNAATEQEVQTANYPFTTVKSNLGTANVRVDCVCKEFKVKDNPIHSICIDGVRFIPVRMLDIPGLVEGAHQGRGLGNIFLDDIRLADVLIHIVDGSGSTDKDGKPVVPGSADPLLDVKLVEDELDYWILSIVNREWSKAIKEANSRGHKVEQLISKRLSGLAIKEDIVLESLKEVGLIGKELRNWLEEDLKRFSKSIRLKGKPIITVANKADLQAASEVIARVKDFKAVIPCSSEAELLLRRAAKRGILTYTPGDHSFELESASLSEPQKKALDLVKTVLKRYGSTGIQEAINRACLGSLDSIIVYPVEDEVKLTDKKGNVLPEARLLPHNTTVKDLANQIHEDLAKGFLFAIDVRTKQRRGSDYQLKNNDVIKIVSTTSRG
jgi:ribosome-binding ATPase YchF (GTP1/OBG family)